MKDKVIEQLKAKHKSSGGKCGIRLIDFNCNMKELKVVLNELYKEGKITVHDNQHGQLIKIN